MAGTIWRWGCTRKSGSRRWTSALSPSTTAWTATTRWTIFTPFRNIINEWYAKDTSKKIRAVFRNKGMSGQRLSTQVPYGYIKDEGGNLVKDEETAPVVRMIFQLCAEGNGPGRIARILREREIPTPGSLAFQRTGRKDRYDPEHPCHWNESSVANILEQPEYLGHTVNFKTTKKSFKSKKVIINPEEKRMVFENTHPAIIDQETWDTVQKNRCQKRQANQNGRYGNVLRPCLLRRLRQ